MDVLGTEKKSPEKKSSLTPSAGSGDNEKKVNFSGGDKEGSPHKDGGTSPRAGKKGNIGSFRDPTTSKKHSDSLKKEKDATKELNKRESLKDISNRHGGTTDNPEVPRRFISTWKQACDKTKDRTRELLKKWRTVPEGEMNGAGSSQDLEDSGSTRDQEPTSGHWSVHVWTTWVKRYPSEEDYLSNEKANNLTSTQKEKLGHFFSHVFDMDRDDMISLQDFESFTERLRHFADWSTNCGEYIVLQQVQDGFVDLFLRPPQQEDDHGDLVIIDLDKRFLSLEDWLNIWSAVLTGVKTMREMPIWLQYFPKVLFQAINRSGSKKISRDELSAFYSSVMGFPPQRVGEIIDKAYNSMTANGDLQLTYYTYSLCFANLLIGRFPNGPGQYIFGCVLKEPPTFPVDYSALNTPPEELEQYTPDKQSNRRSVVV